MNSRQTVALTRLVAAVCPQQAIDDYTPDAWFDLLGDLGFDDCHAAVVAIGKRQPFIAPSEIRDEVRRVRADRITRAIPGTPAPELADQPGRYLLAIRTMTKRLADGFRPPKAITAGPLPGEPPKEWLDAKAAVSHIASEMRTERSVRTRAAEQVPKHVTGSRAAAAEAERTRQLDALAREYPEVGESS